MKFARLGESGSEIPVVLDGDRHLDLRPVTWDVDGRFLADDPVGRTSAAGQLQRQEFVAWEAAR